MSVAANDVYALGALVLLALLPGLAVVAAPWPVVPFLSLAFWLGTWAWGDLLGGSRETFLHAALYVFAGLSALRLPKPLPVSRPAAGTLAVLAFAFAALLPFGVQRVATGRKAPEQALQARLLLAHDGWPRTYAPFDPARPFGVPAGLVLSAADVATIVPVPVWRATLLVGLAARGWLALALLFLMRRLGQPGAAAAAAITLGLGAGLPLGASPALELAAACALVALALMARGTTRAPAVAAGACAAAAWISAPGLALLMLVPGLAWSLRSWRRATAAPPGVLKERLLAAAFGLLVFAGPGLVRLARADLSGEARAGLGLALLLAIVPAVLAQAVAVLPRARRSPAWILAAAVALGGVALSVARDVATPSVNDDDLGAMAFLRSHGTPLDAVCVQDPLRAAWLPAVAERPARVTEGVEDCRWRYLLGPFSEPATGTPAFSVNSLQIVELK